MANTPQLCMNCGERPALPSIGTVPLCSECSPKASKRGVKMTGGKKSSKPKAVKN